MLTTIFRLPMILSGFDGEVSGLKSFTSSFLLLTSAADHDAFIPVLRSRKIHRPSAQTTQPPAYTLVRTPKV
jgi:hypothetical protein